MHRPEPVHPLEKRRLTTAHTLSRHSSFITRTSLNTSPHPTRPRLGREKAVDGTKKKEFSDFSLYLRFNEIN
jgi:hypothetical protein